MCSSVPLNPFTLLRSITTPPSPDFSSHIDTLYSLNTNSRVSLHPAARNHHFTFCESDCSRTSPGSGVTQYLSFFNFSTESSRFTHVSACARVSFLFKAEWWCLSIHPPLTFRLLPPSGYCEWCCCERGGQTLCSRPWFQFSGVCTQACKPRFVWLQSTGS